MPPTSEPDAHGQAALMLAESILHALVDRRLITNDDAIEIVAIAQEVKEEIGKEESESHSRIQKSLLLLSTIATSLQTDQR